MHDHIPMDQYNRLEALKILAGTGTALITAAAGSPVCARPRNPRPLLHRKIPSTGEAIPAVGLGTWSAFNYPRSSAVRARLRRVLSLVHHLGGRVIDTSPMYGEAEQVLGSLISELKTDTNFFYATKVWTNGRRSGINQMNSSFRKMRVSKIDLMQIHNLVDWKTHLDIMRNWKKEGRLRYIGITHYVESAFDDLEKIIRLGGIDFVQLPYSVHLQSAERRLIPAARDKGTAVLVNRPFAGGSLFRRVRGRKLPAFVRDFGCESWAQVFLKFILSNPDVTCAIPGTGKPRHARDNMGAGLGRLPDSRERKRISRIFS